jgi:hypothetical protein
MRSHKKGVAVFLVMISAVLSCVAQDKLRRVEQPAKFTYANTPIQVLVKMDGEPIAGREAVAGPDWLRRVGLEVTNTSGKDIKSLLINLILREPPLGVKATPETVGIVISFELQHSEPQIKVLPAGNRVTLKPPVTMVDFSTKYALEHGMKDIETVVLDIRSVRFTDETGWFLGSRTRKDPETGQYVFVPDDPKPPASYLPASILIPSSPKFFF